MKKTDIKSLIIGFLLSTCIFLFMGNIGNSHNFNEVLKGKIIDLPYNGLDINIKKFPYDKLRVDVVDMP